MNTISQASMVHAAMDGQTLYNSAKVSNKTSDTIQISNNVVTPTGAEVAKNIEQSIAEIKADTQELQKMSEMVTGRKLHFSVNKELNSVVVAIVDSKTNQVLKEIPSEDMQKLKIRIRKAIGSLVDKMV